MNQGDHVPAPAYEAVYTRRAVFEPYECEQYPWLRNQSCWRLVARTSGLQEPVAQSSVLMSGEPVASRE